MTLGECKRRHSELDMRKWNIWFDEDMDRPGKAEFYLMQVAAEVRVLREQVSCLFGGKGREVKLMDFRLRFSEPLTSVPKSAKVAAVISRGIWTSKVGLDLVERRVPKAEGLRIVNETAEEYQKFLIQTEEFRGR